jgi:hypothetical protein
MPWLRIKLGPDLLMTSGMLGTAVALILYGLAHDASIALAASVLAGVSWIAVLARLTASAQVSLPDWVRGRGLALYTTVFFGCLTIGSAVWGKAAAVFGLPAAHFLSAVGVLVSIPLTWPWKLQTGNGVGLTPSVHWPAPITSFPIQHDRGPVLVTVEYRIRPQDRQAFLQETKHCSFASICRTPCMGALSVKHKFRRTLLFPLAQSRELGAFFRLR